MIVLEKWEVLFLILFLTLFSEVKPYLFDLILVWTWCNTGCKASLKQFIKHFEGQKIPSRKLLETNPQNFFFLSNFNQVNPIYTWLMLCKQPQAYPTIKEVCMRFWREQKFPIKPQIKRSGFWFISIKKHLQGCHKVAAGHSPSYLFIKLILAHEYVAGNLGSKGFFEFRMGIFFKV